MSTARKPSVPGALGFALSSLPVGVLSFGLVVALISVGAPAMITVIGLPISALALVLWRGLATIERARVYALLDTHIELPYRPLPQRRSARWRTRLTDPATWRDAVYLVLAFPLGIIEFVLVSTFWIVGLGYLALPVYFRFLPGGAYFFPAYNLRWLTVDSTLAALPWALLGLVFLAIAVPLTRGLAGLHARFAAALLGPRAARAVRSGPAVPHLVAG